MLGEKIVRTKKLTLIILLFLVSSIVICVQPAQAAANVTILTHSRELNPVSKMYSIYGEVQNSGDILVTSVKVEATYYDMNDNVMGSKIGNASMKYVLPGQKCPFVIQLKSDELDTESVIGYSLNVTYTASSVERETGLQIESSSSTTVSDVMHVTGSIKNTASSPANEIWAIVTWYDSTGKVISTNKDTSTPRALTSGQTATFDVSWLGSNSRQSSVASYSITADSLVYSATVSTSTIPEFPPVMILLILVITSLTLMLTFKYKKNLKTN